MLLVINLTDFSITLEQPFEVIIDDCEIDFLNVDQPSVTEFMYDI